MDAKLVRGKAWGHSYLVRLGGKREESYFKEMTSPQNSGRVRLALSRTICCYKPFSDGDAYSRELGILIIADFC